MIRPIFHTDPEGLGTIITVDSIAAILASAETEVYVYLRNTQEAYLELNFDSSEKRDEWMAGVGRTLSGV